MAKRNSSTTTKRAAKKTTTKTETAAAKKKREAAEAREEARPVSTESSAIDFGSFAENAYELLRPIRVSRRTYERAIPDASVREFFEANDFVRFGSRNRVRILRSTGGFETVLSALEEESA